MIRVLTLLLLGVSSVGYADNIGQSETLIAQVPTPSVVVQEKKSGLEKDYADLFDCIQKTYGGPWRPSDGFPNRRVIEGITSSTENAYLTKKGFYFFKRTYEDPSDPGVKINDLATEQKYIVKVQEEITNRYKIYPMLMRSYRNGTFRWLKVKDSNRSEFLTEVELSNLKDAMCTCEASGIAVEQIEKAKEDLEKDGGGFKIKRGQVLVPYKKEDLKCS